MVILKIVLNAFSMHAWFPQLWSQILCELFLRLLYSFNSSQPVQSKIACYPNFFQKTILMKFYYIFALILLSEPRWCLWISCLFALHHDLFKTKCQENISRGNYSHEALSYWEYGNHEVSGYWKDIYRKQVPSPTIRKFRKHQKKEWGYLSVKWVSAKHFKKSPTFISMEQMLRGLFLLLKLLF